MDSTHIVIIGLSLLSLAVIVFLGVSFRFMFKVTQDISGIQRAIFLFMRERFGDLEELMKPK